MLCMGALPLCGTHTMHGLLSAAPVDAGGPRYVQRCDAEGDWWNARVDGARRDGRGPRGGQNPRPTKSGRDPVGRRHRGHCICSRECAKAPASCPRFALDPGGLECTCCKKGPLSWVAFWRHSAHSFEDWNVQVLTTGTFLRGEIFIGTKSFPAGRQGEGPAVGLARTLEDTGFALGRLRTGTPPRVARDSINVTGLSEQVSDDPPVPFSYLSSSVNNADRLVSCHLTYTNPTTHKLVRDNLHLSRYLGGDVEANAPRWACGCALCSYIWVCTFLTQRDWLTPLHYIVTLSAGTAHHSRPR